MHAQTLYEKKNVSSKYVQVIMRKYALSRSLILTKNVPVKMIL